MKISNCPESGLDREAEMIGVHKNMQNKVAQIGFKVTKLKDGKPLTSKSNKPYTVNVMVDNKDDDKAWDKLVEDKTDKQLADGLIPYADSKNLFDK